ncbi:DUF817 domain-containing protein [Pseudochrobactrum sp. sp1633]|uniref:DUF817 domain-containing protein n=1 Tax=Pseudochrobactrum sp. sp1633 TaxID=3036706 RepID=UPI0025A5B043|nr:DUF817 domain-containing protein [Pseudochrobactrum sp. sp1633]MDM8345957.1 DUF817 domain-containing protein [Pseudochrobactrum sp. sp1633]HWD12180.1 DUF817 domain-containing protein [Pseudochrobactrum sp.]
MQKPVSGVRRYTSLESRIDHVAHRLLDRLPQHGISGALVEFLVFGLKQAWACLFGGVMLGLIILSKYLWADGSALPQLITRYDFLFLSAVTIQVLMLLCRLETLREAKVILIFHIVGTAMEVFKTHMGSWIYPEENLFRIGGVPLFSGFMYAAVGSYMARINRIFDIRLANYPQLPLTFALATGIYINFFSHHYLPDMRWLLFGLTALMFWRTSMHYRVFRFRHRMPLLLAFFLTSLFIWIAENIGTWSRVWLYPGQHDQWVPVSLSKLGAWYLLMIISVVLVTIIHPPKKPDAQQ